METIKDKYREVALKIANKQYPPHKVDSSTLLDPQAVRLADMIELELYRAENSNEL